MALASPRPPNDFRFVFDQRLGSYRYLETLKPGESFAAAVAAFGTPSSRGTPAFQHSNLCTVWWKALGLDIDFASQLGPCARAHLTRSLWYGMRLHSRAWLVDKGLRIGDSEAKLRRLYPRARLLNEPPDAPTYWLRTGKSEADRTIPLLAAEVWAGQVVSITVEAGSIF
jgi:hypothetical protein